MNFAITLKIIASLLAIYLLIVFYVYVKQRSLLYLPNIDNYEDESLNIVAENIYIKNTDNINHRSLYYEHPANTGCS